MSQQPTDILGQPGKLLWAGGVTSAVAIVVLIAILVGGKLFLCRLANADATWGAMAIGFFVAPIANGIVGLFWVVSTLVGWRRTGLGWSTLLLVLSIVLPVIAAYLVFLYVARIPGSGC
jgi:hypothetical protein